MANPLPHTTSKQATFASSSDADVLEPAKNITRKGSRRKKRVAVLMGSSSDLDVMRPALTMLEQFGVPYHLEVISAHRTPSRVHEFAASAREKGFRVLVAGAGGAAHLPGMLAANTTVPVIGVPVPTRHLSGLDSLYSIVQMPAGVPVATVSIGGAENAALLAIQILSNSDRGLADMLQTHRDHLIDKVEIMNEGLSARTSEKSSAP